MPPSCSFWILIKKKPNSSYAFLNMYCINVASLMTRQRKSAGHLYLKAYYSSLSVAACEHNRGKTRRNYRMILTIWEWVHKCPKQGKGRVSADRDTTPRPSSGSWKGPADGDYFCGNPHVILQGNLARFRKCYCVDMSFIRTETRKVLKWKLRTAWEGQRSSHPLLQEHAGNINSRSGRMFAEALE